MIRKSATTESDSTLSSRRFFSVMAQQLLGTVLKICTGVILAWMLSATEFGEFNAAYGVMMIASVVAGLGLNQFVVRPFRHAITTGDYSIARGLRYFIPLCIIAASAVSIGILFGTHLLYSHHSMVQVESFAAVLAMLPLVAMMSYLVSTANTHGAAGRAMFLATTGLQTALLLGLGIIWYLAGDSFGVLGAAGVWVAASFVICLALWRLNRVVEKRQFKSGPRRTNWGSWARGSFPYLILGVVTMFLIQSPFVVLGWIHANGEDAAMFAAADHLAQLLSVFGAAALAVFSPAIADAIESKDRLKYTSLIRRWWIVVCPATIVSAILISVFGSTLLGFYGDQYLAAYWLLVIIAAAIAITNCLLMFVSALQYVGGGRSVIVISAIWTVTGFAAMVVMGHYWQEMGVAITQAVAFIGMYATMMIRSSILIRRHMSM